MATELLHAILVLVCLGGIAECSDIRLGYASPQSRKVFSEIREADPALWKRTDDIIVNAPANEVISAVFVTDLRDDKDGEAYIESGGIGDKSVTIGLKSPTILRGYKFEIEVYTNNPLSQIYSKGGYTSYSADIQYPRKY
ncbi:unnamed protein product, partial [Iphiclides podalirius]